MATKRLRRLAVLAVLALLALATPALATIKGCDECFSIEGGGSELFIGAPGEDIGSTMNAGLVSRWTDFTSTDQLWQGGTTDGMKTPGSSETGDGFANDIATGDFNGDGYGDVAMGMPYEDLGSKADAGVVIVYYGATNGSDTFGATQVIYQGAAADGTAEADDRFGYSIAARQLGDDIYDELVVGVPGEDLGSIVDAGMIQIIGGGPTGLSGSINLHQNSPGVGGAAEAGDQFGYELAIGGEGVDHWGEIFVGVPFEDIGNITDAGIVQSLTIGEDGSFYGLDYTYYQGKLGIAGTPEAGDRFGEVLTMGDITGFVFEELAIGVPYEDIGSKVDAGMVHVLYGQDYGITADGIAYWQGKAGVGGSPEADDRFGSALVFIQNSTEGQLAIGAPGEDIGTTTNAGMVHIVSEDDLASGLDFVHQGTMGINGGNEAGDEFGAALTITDHNGDKLPDLVIGGPGENNDAGVIWILRGASLGITNEDSTFHQGDGTFVGTHEAGDRFGAVLEGERPWSLRPTS